MNKLLETEVEIVNELGVLEVLPLDEALFRLEQRACEVLEPETVLADIACWQYQLV